MQARDILTTNVITEGLRRSRRLELLVSNVRLAAEFSQSHG